MERMAGSSSESARRGGLRTFAEQSMLAWNTSTSKSASARPQVEPDKLLGVCGAWQCERNVWHLVKKRLVDLSHMLGELDTRSRNFHWSRGGPEEPTTFRRQWATGCCRPKAACRLQKSETFGYSASTVELCDTPFMFVTLLEFYLIIKVRAHN